MTLTGINHPRWAGPRYCKVCGVELFNRRQRNVLNCRSNECLHKARSQAHTRNKNGRWKGGIVYCKQCRTEIIHSARLQSIFCSRTCSAKWQSENLSGPNSHAWKGEERVKSHYPPEWTSKLRHSIRTRDGFKCTACYTKEWPLDVHHIDKNKFNCHPDNLITLCRSCHRYIESGTKLLVH